jgi:hypothetical protein
MHEDTVGRSLFGKIMLDQQLSADAFKIDHTERSAFAEGAGRAMRARACLVFAIRHRGEPLREVDAICWVVDHCLGRAFHRLCIGHR